jgi:tetratricopeptide (TPR) repeat protein
MTSAGWSSQHGAVVLGNARALRAHRAACDVHITQAKRAFDADKFAAALDIAAKLLTRDPGNLDGNHIAGLAAHQLGHSQLAIQYLAKTLLHDRSGAEHHYALAWVLSESGDYRRAQEHITCAIELNDDDARFHDLESSIVTTLAFQHDTGGE